MVEAPSQRSTKRARRLVHLVVAAASLFTSLAHAQTAAVPGTVPGSLTIGNDGTSSYDVPLAVPQGVEGMQPNLALRYNSGNRQAGPVGLGWTLTGTSAIQRCGKTAYIDGASQPVQFDTRDRLCLDGQRLINITGTSSDADYWLNGQTYRTAPDSWSRITMSCFAGACSFRVEAKDGRISEYAQRAEYDTASGQKVTDTWLLSEVRDRSGNKISYAYHTGSMGTSSVKRYKLPRLSTVTYGPHKISFVYTSLSSGAATTLSYRGGYAIESSDRLSTIYLITGTTHWKRYELTYEGSAASGRQRLAKIKECTPTGGCVLPIEFAYSDGARKDGYFAKITSLDQSLQADSAILHYGDWDADGRTEFLRQSISKSARPGITRYYPYESWFSSTPVDTNSGRNLLYEPGAQMHTGDFNGDGYTDFLEQERGDNDYDLVKSFHVHMWSPEKQDFDLIRPGKENSSGDIYQDLLRSDPGANLITGDFDGDGMTDFIRQEKGGWDDDSTGTFSIYFSIGDGTFRRIVHTGADLNTNLRSDSGAKLIPGDFNGDGKTDFIRQEHGSWGSDTINSFSVYFSRGDGNFDISRPGSNVANDPYQDLLRDARGKIIPGDYNGDGLTDFVRQQKATWNSDIESNWQVYLSKGTGDFEIVQASLYHKYLGVDQGFNLIPGDFNGDGRTDLVAQIRGDWALRTSHPRFSILYSRGNGEFELTTPTGPYYGAALAALTESGQGVAVEVADLNGDGQSDLVVRPQKQQFVSANAYLSNGLAPDHMLVKVTNGPTRERLFNTLSGGAFPAHPRNADERHLAGGWVPSDWFIEPADGSRLRVRRHYSFEGGMVDTKGRAQLGFRKVVITTYTGEDAQSMAQSASAQELLFRTDFPFQGRITKLTEYGSGNRLKETRFQYEALNPSALLPVVVLKSEETSGYIADVENTEKTEYWYDAYANEVLVGNNITSSSPLYACTKYNNDQANWFVAQPLERQLSNNCYFDPASRSCSCYGETYDLKRFQYSSAGLLLSTEALVPGRGWVGSHQTRDAQGRVIEIVSPANVVQKFEFENSHSPLPHRSILDPNGKALTETYQYHPHFGVLLEKQDAAGATIKQTLDPFGRVDSRTATDDNGSNYTETFKITWDGNTTFVSETTRSEGGRVLRRREVMDYMGRLIREEAIGDDNATRSYKDTEWDLLGRLTRESAPYRPGETPRFRSFEYDYAGRAVRVTEPSGLVLSTSYRWGGMCAPNEVEHDISSSGGRRRFECHDNRGKVTEEIDFHEQGQLTKLSSYDGLGRLVVTRVVDDSIPNVTNSLETRITYDRLGRKIRESNSQHGVTEFAYDLDGKLTSKKVRTGVTLEPEMDRPGNDYRTYDGQTPENCRAICDTDQGCLAYTWAPQTGGMGRCFLKNARGTAARKAGHVSGARSATPYLTTTYAYDTAGRLVEERTHDGQLRTLEYDQGAYGKGRLSSVTSWDAGGRLIAARQRTYDQRGRVKAETLRLPDRSYAQSYTYFPDNRPATLVYPDGSELTYQYDVEGNLRRLSIDGTSYVEYGAYTSRGQPGSISYGNGVTTDLGYDQSGLLASIATRGYADNGSASSLMNRRYTWNTYGEVTGIEDVLQADLSQTFSYNRLGYLTLASGPYGNLAYAYDGLGNILQKRDLTLSYLRGQQLTGNSRGESFASDGMGRRVAKYGGDASWQYEYDAHHQLQSVVKDGVEVLRNTYDPDGERLARKDASGNRTLYAFPLYEITTLADGREFHTKYVPGLTGRSAAVTLQESSSGSVPQGAMLPHGGRPNTSGLANELRRDERSSERRWTDGLRIRLRDVWLALLVASTSLVLLLSLAGWFRPTQGAASAVGRFRRVLGELGGTRLLARKRWLALPLPALVPALLMFCVAGCQPGGEDLILSGGDYELVVLDNGLFYAPINPALLPGKNGDGYPTIGTQFFHQDHLGTTSLVTDARGQAIAKAMYLPFGETYEPETAGADVYRDKFTGKEWDADAGLYYYGERFYDPETGRFIQADSEVFGSTYGLSSDLNRYVYAGNNPLKYTDPSGNFAFIPALISAIVALVKAAVVGGVCNVAVDFVIHSIEGREYTWEDAGKSFGIGAASAVIGLGVGSALGAAGSAFARAFASRIGTGARALGSGMRNVLEGFAEGFSENALEQVSAGNGQVDFRRAAAAGAIGGVFKAASGARTRAGTRDTSAASDAIVLKELRDGLGSPVKRGGSYTNAARDALEAEQAIKGQWFDTLGGGATMFSKPLHDLSYAARSRILENPLGARLVYWTAGVPEKVVTPLAKLESGLINETSQFARHELAAE